MSFANLFKARPRGPQELVRVIRDGLTKLDGPAVRRGQGTEDPITRNIAALKVMLQGTADADPSPENINIICHEVFSSDFLPLLALSLSKLDFEARKDSTAIFNILIKQQVGHQQPGIIYLVNSRPDTLITLVRGYENKEIASNCGQILREALKYEGIARVILYNQIFWNFFTYVQGGQFDVSSDAFSTFKDLLTKHKVLVAEFIQMNYDDFFGKYNLLLHSDNYITKRQSIKLLGEILLDRANYNIMTAYVDSPDHLKLCMVLLRDKSKNVQYEAFHVFKVFVANPKKSPQVESLLLRNREQLLRFLPKFHEDRKEDDQFNDEKAFLIRQIESMGPAQAPPV